MTSPENGLIRLARIAEAHCKLVSDNGTTSGDCAECDWPWPCATYRWATNPRCGATDVWDADDHTPLKLF
jgi:hypothetical protein